ncbi:PQQ-binding-like beta-propeller repeat protein [Actinoplanes sp. NPDC049265]|uniref:outer membrane protein assembly factor BamB family protein n=1 Tax=Actinoplanes sp. NPDC049265 TaxID=3363902 RepID=UPI00371C565C
MVGVPVIDLDVDPPPASPGPGRGGPRRMLPRPLIALVLVAVVLAGATGDRPPGPVLRQVLTAGGTAAAAFELGRDTLYTATYGVDNPNTSSAVRRYDLIRGREVWAVSLPQGVQNLVISDAAGVLMARSGTDPRITFLDAATGAVLWTSAEANTVAVTIARAGVLFTTDTPDGTLLRLLDARTGHPVWERRLVARVFFGPDVLYDGAPSRVAVAEFDGRVTVLDYATGRELSHGDVGGPLRPAQFPDLEGVLIGTVGANRMVVRRKVAGRASMTAYSLVPFGRLWQRTAGPTGLASDCGPVWCVASAVPGISALGDPSAVGVSAVDPDTGQPLWTNRELSFAFRFDEHTVLAGDDQETPEVTLRDPRTGRLLQRLGTVVRTRDLLLHPDTAAPGWTWVEIRDRAGRVRPLGVVAVGAAFGCEQHDNYLACPTLNGPTVVWRFPES